MSLGRATFTFCSPSLGILRSYKQIDDIDVGDDFVLPEACWVKHSSKLESSGILWTERNMMAFLKNPRAFAGGRSHLLKGGDCLKEGGEDSQVDVHGADDKDAQDRVDIIHYLQRAGHESWMVQDGTPHSQKQWWTRGVSGPTKNYWEVNATNKQLKPWQHAWRGVTRKVEERKKAVMDSLGFEQPAVAIEPGTVPENLKDDSDLQTWQRVKQVEDGVKAASMQRSFNWPPLEVIQEGPQRTASQPPPPAPVVPAEAVFLPTNVAACEERSFATLPPGMRSILIAGVPPRLPPSARLAGAYPVLDTGVHVFPLIRRSQQVVATGHGRPPQNGMSSASQIVHANVLEKYGWDRFNYTDIGPFKACGVKKWCLDNLLKSGKSTRETYVHLEESLRRDVSAQEHALEPAIPFKYTDCGPFKPHFDFKVSIEAQAPLEADSGGIQVNEFQAKETLLKDDSVAWALLRWEVGSGTFVRSKLVAIHFNGDEVPTVRRGRLNARSAEVLGLLGEAHATIEVKCKEDLHLDFVCERLMKVLTSDSMAKSMSAEALRKDYEMLIEKTKSEKAKGKDKALRVPRTVKDHPGKQISVDRILAAVGDTTGPYNWALLEPERLELHNAGYGGLVEMKDWLAEDLVLFGMIRKLQRLLVSLQRRTGGTGLGEHQWMPPKAEEDRPYRGTRAGPKARKRRFYQIQDDLVEAGQRLFSVRVQKATFEEISDGHHTAVLEFNEAGGLRIDEEHPIWEDLAGYYPELSRAVAAVVERRGAAQSAPSSSSKAPAPKAKWQPKAKAKEPAEPPPAKAKAKARALGITGPTKDLYQPSRRDPLRRRRVPPAEELEEDDVGTRSRSEPPPGDASVDLSAAGGALEGTTLGSARRARTPPRTRTAEAGFIRDLRLRGSVLASLHCGEQAEPEATEEEPTAGEPTAKEEPATAEEAEVEETEGQQDYTVSAEGAAEGAPGEGAEEEEEPEQDVEVEVPASVSERTRSPSPSGEAAQEEDAAEALSAPDPYDLPEEEAVQHRGAARGAPAEPRAAPPKRPFTPGEVVEAEVEETAPVRHRRPSNPPAQRPRVTLIPAAKGSASERTAAALRINRPPPKPPTKPRPAAARSVRPTLEAEEEPGPRERTRTPRRADAAPSKGAAQAHRGAGKSGSWPPRRRTPSHDEGAASEGDTPRSSAPVTKADLPKKVVVRPAVPRKVPPTDRHGVRYKAAPDYPPGAVPQRPPQYKGPPHEVFVRNVAGREGPEARSTGKAPPPQVTGNRQKLAYHAWYQQQRAEEEAQAAASGAATSSRVPRVLASRTEITVVFDWHNVLDKAWVEARGANWQTQRGSHGYFKVPFTEALKAFVIDHRPVCVAILSYCSRASAAWFEHHFLREAADCLVRDLPSSTRIRYGQTFSRTGPDGKAQQLSQIDPPASLIIDDNRAICKECRKTGALVVQAEKGGDIDQILYELDQASRLIKRTGRDSLPRARRLEPQELLFEA
ncbi:unnamed protein product [Symbiodinium sp. KB8]|nr:unnamed protein product [Symbiodinium sp. KB8]